MAGKESFLVADIGNSRIKLAVFSGGKIISRHSKEKFLVSEIKKLCRQYGFRHSIFSNVRERNPGFINFLSTHTHAIEFGYKLPLPIKNEYRTPETLGMDRLASVIGAHTHYPGENILVVDMGTCIKYDFISSKGIYEGGNIAPGLEMRLESMHTMTGKLPRARRRFNREMLGKSTLMALQNGAVWGIKLELENFIETLTANKGKLRVILSGGDSKYFGEILESRIFVHPDLVLRGLYETLWYNIR